jgi:hypothetical protein
MPTGTYRLRVNQIDKSAFTNTNTDETGAMVIWSSKGPSIPVLCQSPSDVITNFGNPSSTYPSVFEALAFTTAAPCYVSSVYGAASVWGGVDVCISGVNAFGTGRNINTFTYGTFPTVSHSFFAASPYVDDLAGQIDFLGGKKFKLTLYKVTSTGNQYINQYTYSLLQEKDGFGASLYIFDVFMNNAYVIPKVNTAFVPTNYGVSGVVTTFTGGTRVAPIASDYLSAWNNFQYSSKYPAKIFMDPAGNSANTINTIIQTYQPYAHGITVTPQGNTAAQAVSYRSGLSLDTSNMSLYTNWSQIQDQFNNSYAWISQIGSIGKRYALCFDAFDAESPAGVNENGHGGQLNDWQVITVDNSYSDLPTGGDLQNLDNAQINPVILDEVYGPIVQGDKTLQVSNSSLSFVGHRRLYNYIINIITKQILRKQEFKINDPNHQLTARTLIDNFLSPIKSRQYLMDYYVICDSTNNTGATLNNRQFICDVYLQVTPNSQFVQLNMIYTPATGSIKASITG